MVDYRGVRLGIRERSKPAQVQVTPGSSLKMVLTDSIDIEGIECLDQTEVTILKGK